SIDAKVDELENTSIELLKLPNSIKELDQRSDLGELINTIRELLFSKDNKSDETIIQIIKSNIKESYEFVDPIHQISFTDDEISTSLEAAKIINNNQKYYENSENIEALLNFKATLRLVDNKSLSNIYRQSFINIFSIFDATVFDILKEYFKNNIEELEIFFNPSNSNNSKLKYTFEDILEFDDLDSL